jgi:thiamine kinase-like enzyme
MILSKSNIGFFLYHQGFLKSSDYQQNFLEITEKRSKNLSFFVKHSNGNNFFVKQQLEYGDYDIQMWQQEVLFYKNVNIQSNFTKIIDFLPNYIGHNLSNKILVLELLEGYSDLEKTIIDDEKGLKVVHFLKTISSISFENTDETNVPWIFNFDNFNHNKSIENPIFKLVSKNNDLVKALNNLTNLWQPNCLIHNDIKLNNILINNSQSIKIIDWEMVSIGDSYWDLACFFQSLYFYKIFSNKDIVEAKSLLNFLRFDNLTSLYQKDWSESQKEKLIKFMGAAIILRGSALVETISVQNFYTMIVQIGTQFLLNPKQYFDIFFHE